MSVDVGSAIAYLDLDTSKFTSNLSSAKSALKDFVNSSDTLSTKFQNFGSSVSSFGSSLTKTLTLPLVGVGTAATKVASDFESSMSKVKAISGATGDEMSALTDKAIEMGAKTKFSAKESADAFTYMAMAGWDASQMIDGISGIMSLAAADGLDLATTSDIVTDALTAFGLQASDSAHFADILAQASSSANTNVSMLGESFKYVAPVAGSLGMTAEDTAFALGLMANAGIKSSQAGTSLRASITNLVKPTDAMASKMEELGIEVTNSDGTMKSLKEILDILRNSFSNLAESEKASAAATIFGKEAMSGMLAIINASESDYNKLADAIANCDGRADEMSGTMMNNLSGAIEQLKGAFESLMIKLGTALIPTIQSVTEFITKLVEKLNKLSDEQVEQIVRIAAIVAAVGPLLAIISKVISLIGTVIKIGKTLHTGISAICRFTNGALIPALAGVNSTVLIIIGVIGALIAVGVLLYKNWDTICEVAKNVWDAIVGFIKNAVDAIVNLFKTLTNLLLDIISMVSSAVSALWDTIVGFFSNLFSSLVSWFASVTSSIAGFFAELGGNIASAIASIWNAIVEWGANLISKAVEIGSGFVNGLVGFFSDLVSRVYDAISGMLSMIAGWGLNIINKAAEIGVGFTKGIISGLEKVGSFFLDIFTDILDSIVSVIPKVFEAGKNIILGLWEGMKAVFGGLVSWITDGLASLFSPITSFLGSIFSPITDFFGGIFGGIGGFFSGLFGGSHAGGLDYVPYNGYVAELHQGERVLTREENEEYNRGRSGGGDTYIFNSPEPIDEYQAARLMKQTKQELDMDV